MNFINIIHDSRMQDRYEHIVNEISRQGISNYTIWPAIILPQVIDSINASHKAIVRQAKENKMDAICIMEDDTMFPAVDGWSQFAKQFFDNIPDSYDLYMAGTYSVIEPGNKVTCPVGLHCYIINSRFYSKFLSIPDNVHIDTGLQGLGEFYVCHPMVALQREGFSANNKTHVNYNTSLKKEDVYGW